MDRLFIGCDHSGNVERLLEETRITIQIDLHFQTIIALLSAERDYTDGIAFITVLEMLPVRLKDVLLILGVFQDLKFQLPDDL
ncbi:MAG: hypothetical protein WA915_04085 [Candidatus Aminicenantaceae bacterium]